MLKKALSLIMSLFLTSGQLAPEASASARLGLWVTVFSEGKVLHSRENCDRLLSTCERSGVTDIYLQLYRSDKAYYDSNITDRSAFEQVKKSAGGEDLIPYLIKKASEKGIKTHAWINLLSLAHNSDANILKKIGQDALTFDQKGRPSRSFDGKKDDLDKYYPREDQLFLEPGDWRVRDYLGSIAEEILVKYPGLAGLHLDYIRYPTVTPYIPGARFTSNGISYGYNRLNMLNFTKSSGLDPQKMPMNRTNALLWDKWRRDQVTRIADYISKKARKTVPSIEISATIVPSIEKAYFSTFQNWAEWLDKNIVDSVIVMNYTDDMDLVKLYTSSLASDKVQMGLGAYIMKDNNSSVKTQLDYLKENSPGGVVIFSYDDIMNNEEIKNYLEKNFRTRRKPF